MPDTHHHKRVPRRGEEPCPAKGMVHIGRVSLIRVTTVLVSQDPFIFQILFISLCNTGTKLWRSWERSIWSNNTPPTGTLSARREGTG